MRILILGDGFLGKKYYKYFKDSIISDAKINSVEDVVKEINLYSPSVIINCIGKTGRPNIDWCEDNKFETSYSNVIVPIFIQEACKIMNVKMVHISTGCIYYGNKYFKEDDIPNFIESYYCKTKYAIETMLDNNVLQIRIRMPIDETVSNRNLLTKLLSYKETINELNSITIIPDLMKATDLLLRQNKLGIFNVVNPDPVRHTDIINIYNKYSSNKKIIHEITTLRLTELTKAGRSNCTLSTDKLNDCGIYMRNTLESLDECIKEYVNAQYTTII